jgi:mono/diheme cytochrome c family protein
LVFVLLGVAALAGEAPLPNAPPDSLAGRIETVPRIAAVLPDLGLAVLDGGADLTFRLSTDQKDGRYRKLTYLNDRWYGSTYWTGPDWTRVGKDWHHPGIHTPSVRCWTAPRDGRVTVTGRVYKAHLDGDGIRAIIRHGAETVWQAEIEGKDAQGKGPKFVLDVKRGDAVRFVVHKRGRIFCDTTRWDPVVTYDGGESFRASEGFSVREQGENQWSYEMQTDARTEPALPTVHALGADLAPREATPAVGRPFTVGHADALPFVVLADGESGVVLAPFGSGPWAFRAEMLEGRRLHVTLDAGQSVMGAFSGQWAKGVALIEKLRASKTHGASLRARVDAAFKRMTGKPSCPELDLLLMVLADWRRQDKRDGSMRADDAWPQYFRTRWTRRVQTLARLGDVPLLFCKRVPTSYSHLVMQYYGWRARPGGGLFVLDRPGRSLACRDILGGRLAKGNVLEPRLSYDGKRIVFSYVECPDGPLAPGGLRNDRDVGFYHIWTVNVDGSDLRQVTAGPYDDVMPTWLPDGGIAFCSTRRGGYARCFGGQFSQRWHVYTLHRVEADGSRLTRLSSHDTNEWFPTVSNTGHLLYARWDYIDRDAVTHQNLWATRPDGTNPIAVWGNATPKPHCTFQAQAIPGSRKLVFVASAHHSIAGGPVCLLDPAVDPNSQDAITRLTPQIPFPEAESRDIREYYTAPWPLSEDLHLVAYSPQPLVWEPGANAANALGLYLLSSDNRRELLYRDPEIGCTNPCPLRPRPTPPVLGPQPDRQVPKGMGEMVLLDVHEGLGDVPRGSIRALRVVQILPKTTNLANNPPIGAAGEENARAILGTVPVEADGSARFLLPANTPVLFQALDEDGMAYQTMRSLTYVQSQERVSCIGCHEHRGMAPPNGQATALGRPPSRIEPGPFGGRPFSYVEVVQPVLDRHCVTCHGAPKPKKGIDLTGAAQGAFSRSYVSLTSVAGLVPRFAARNQLQRTPPGGAWGARGSRLLRHLGEGHSKVKLSVDEVRRLALWIDMNAIFYGVNLPQDQARQRRGERVAMPVLQ